jgi:tetrahydromethanopterin S-methyltransferase subunit G
MKKRNGFVSNSSSSSFCIVGVYFDDAELALKALSIDVEGLVEPGCECNINREQLESEDSKFCPNCGAVLFKKLEYWDLHEKLDEICRDKGVELTTDEECVYVGKDIGNDTVEKEVENMLDAKKKLVELFGESVSIRVHSGTIYN